MERKNNNKIEGKGKLISLLCLFALLLPLAVTSIPVPQGVSGMVYDLDGVTSVGNNIQFSVTNLNNGNFVSGTTNHGTAGRYSASVQGNSGDQVLIRVWNEWHSSNRTVTLTGVLRGVDLVLNMTPPPLPLEIMTTTLPLAYEDVNYSVQIIAQDINKDNLSYQLLAAPSDLSVNQSGWLWWQPTQLSLGNHTISLVVSDGMHYANATYTLHVQEVNDPLLVLSKPSSVAIRGSRYQYDFTVYDEENQSVEYGIAQGPIDATIHNQTGVLLWTPQQIGTVNFTLTASDGAFVYHNFTVTVVQPPAVQSQSTSSQGSAGGGGAGGGASIAVPTRGLGSNISGDISLEDLTLGSPWDEEQLAFLADLLDQHDVVGYPEHDLSVTTLSTRPDTTEPLSLLTYQYLEIDSATDEPTTLIFAVSGKWMESYDITYNDIVLRRYAEEGWEALDTKLLTNYDGSVLFSANTPGFSYFAITADSPAQPGDYVESVLRLPYIVKGIIHRWGRFAQYPENTPVFIENLNNSWSYTVFTGVPGSTGAYLASVPGIEGDVVRISVDDFSEDIVLGREGTITRDVVKRIFGSGFELLTGNAVLSSSDLKKIPLMGLITLLGLVGSVMFIRRRYRNEE